MTNRNKPSDFDPRILEICGGDVHGKIDTRDVLKQAVRLATLGMSAAAILQVPKPDYALAQQAAPRRPGDLCANRPLCQPTRQWPHFPVMARPADAQGQLGARAGRA